MTHTRTLTTCVAAFLAAIPGLSGRASLVTFDGFTLPPAGYDNGSTGHGGFTEAGAHFNNAFTDWGGGYTSWAGFAVSNVNNPTTPGYLNQYAAGSPGTGVGGAGNYAVLYDGFAGEDMIDFGENVAPLSLSVNNTAYAAQALLNGDAPARKFVNGDWFRLTIRATDGLNQPTGAPVDVFLADFRSGGSFILQSWQPVDLTPLGASVRKLHFDFASSDTGAFINTPTYAAFDNLAFVPEPAAAGLFSLGLLLLRPRRR